MWKVREMQQAGGTLGLTDTIEYENEEKYLTSNNPNLDIHMQKKTESGAMAILSASSYGNPNPIANGETTTGNHTGIYINTWGTSGELVAGGDITNYENYTMAMQRYKNSYTLGTYVAKVGDAMEETYKWHCRYDSSWINKTKKLLVRNYVGRSIFNYSAIAETNTSITRAVIVVGSGV